MDKLMEILKDSGFEITESELRERITAEGCDPDGLSNGDIAKLHRKITTDGIVPSDLSASASPLKSRYSSKTQSEPKPLTNAKSRKKPSQHREALSSKAAEIAHRKQAELSGTLKSAITAIESETANTDRIVAELAEQHAYNTDPHIIMERVVLEAARIQQQNSPSTPAQPINYLRGVDTLLATVITPLDKLSDLDAWLQETEELNNQAVMQIAASVEA